MTRPEVPESQARELQALYREAATDEPGPALDSLILEAARADLAAAAAPGRRPAPWWKGWLPAASAVAAVLVGISLTWRVMDEQERQLREETRRGSASEPAPAVASDKSPGATVASQANKADQASPHDRVPDSTQAVKPPAVAAEPRISEAPASAAPAPLEVDARKATESRRETAVQDAGPAARASGKLEAAHSGASSEAAGLVSSTPVAKTLAAPDAASPEAWLQRIRELRAAGRDAEAAQSLARFRQRYPDFPLPAELR